MGAGVDERIENWERWRAQNTPPDDSGYVLVGFINVWTDLVTLLDFTMPNWGAYVTSGGTELDGRDVEDVIAIYKRKVEIVHPMRVGQIWESRDGKRQIVILEELADDSWGVSGFGTSVIKEILPEATLRLFFPTLISQPPWRED